MSAGKKRPGAAGDERAHRGGPAAGERAGVVLKDALASELAQDSVVALEGGEDVDVLAQLGGKGFGRIGHDFAAAIDDQLAAALVGAVDEVRAVGGAVRGWGSAELARLHIGRRYFIGRVTPAGQRSKLGL